MLCLVQSSEGWGSSTAADRSRCKGWNPGTLLLQLLDGSDRPRAGRAEGTGTFPSQHKALVEQDCSPRPGWELEQLPFCCSWLSYKAELKETAPSVAANPFIRGHLSQVTRSPAPDTLKSRCRCLDSGIQPPCATSPSPAPVCDFFLVLVRRFFRRERGKAHKILMKGIKVFYSTCTFTTENLF